MKLRRSLALSRKALLRHRVRTALAVSGTGIGVAALIVMVAVGEGARRELVREVERLGGNLLVVAAGRSDPLAGRPGTGGLVNTLKPADAAAIVARVPTVERAVPSVDEPRTVTYGPLSLPASIRATTADYEEVRNFRVVRGRYFTPEEDASRLRLAVVGSRIVETLFEGADPVGATIRIGRVPFEVIGALESKGASADGGRDEDNQILIPLRTGMRRVFNVDYVTLVYARVREAAEMELAERGIASVLRDRHELRSTGRPDDFRIDNQRIILESSRETDASLRRLLVALAAVALVVGGVGILSIMMLSLRERRNEIGLRVAVGAKRRDVRAQFLLEAVMLGGSGALAGLVVGIGVAAAIGRLTHWPTAVSGSSIAVAIGAALGVALLFGVVPAQRAASLDPIESLRAE